MKVKILFLLSLIILSSCSYFRNKNSKVPLPNSLEEAVDSSARAEENVERDDYQNPVETLQFFGLKPDMTVVEIQPGSGYYTEILAPYLSKQGQYVMAVPRLPSNPPPFLIENEKKIQQILLQDKEIMNKTRFIPFEPLDKRNKIKPGFADMVLNFSNVHNWVAKDSASMAFKYINEILKPGGILGIVQHRIPEGKRNLPKSGYMTEKEVINMAKIAGLKFVGKSDINANPKDTADYPGGVWTLPPTYRMGEKNKDKYERIGESDKMTLKFIKEK